MDRGLAAAVVCSESTGSLHELRSLHGRHSQVSCTALVLIPPACVHQVVVSNTVTAGQISAFSSFGPALDLSFKPDLAAPGNLIVRCRV